MILSTVGLIHFIASIFALITGSIVLFRSKGDRLHKQIGYLYSISMFSLLATSFMIYRLHGSFGILHWLAVLSSISLIAGMIPILIKWPRHNYFTLHFSFMYWSVIGLYCAFFAEVFTRIPFLLNIEKNLMFIFYAIIGLSTGLTGYIASKFFKKYKLRWENFYGQTTKNKN